MIATIGVEDLVIVDAADTTLVARSDRVQGVIDALMAADRKEHIFHRKVYRPCGSYDSIGVGERF